MPVDRLELSQQAQSTGRAADAQPAGEGIRAEKVAAIRRAIAEGTYETPDKLDIALDRMLNDFG